MQRLIKRYAVLRKGIAYAGQVPRALRRLGARREDYRRSPPVLADSFPKSGTHLMLQALRGIPGTVYFGSFLASMPSVTFRERSPERHEALIGKIVPGEVVPAHLFFSPLYREALAALDCVHYFIYRDPRDVAVSEAHYLAEMNRWHRMHRYFSRVLKSPGERLSAAILGVRDPSFPCDYPDIGARFGRYAGWLDCEEVLPVRFEDLVSPGGERGRTLERMASFYLERGGREGDPGGIARAMGEAIDPSRSHTFRSGGTGGWKREFTEKHREEMKSVAGELLVKLGYEKDTDW